MQAQFDPDNSAYIGPRCSRCHGPCDIWFGPSPGRYCPVCDGSERDRANTYRVYCTVVVKAAHAEHANSIVMNALAEIGTLVSVEPSDRLNKEQGA